MKTGAVVRDLNLIKYKFLKSKISIPTFVKAYLKQNS